MTKFEVGKTYTAKSLCDSECIFRFTVQSRTPKTVTLVDDSGERFQKCVAVYRGEEVCHPLGTYSMNPTLRAGRVSA